MSSEGVSLLDLPSVRGNPFDNRPIEASRARDLVGREKILHRWRDHILSGSPRMILLVGDSGSGRTSMINTISSLTPKKYIGQYLSESDDQVRTVLHEIVTHFGSFQSIPTMNQLSQKLVSIFDEETGQLPLIALDYPSQVIDINSFLSRISPILSRLRAITIVSLTESQYLDLDDRLREMFDEPDRISNFTKNQIQEMVNNRMRLKSKERWNINSQILDSIHTSTGGNPRDVIRILKRLVDEKRDLGCHGTLENLMSWQNHSPPNQTNTDIYSDSEVIEKDDMMSPITIFEDDNIDNFEEKIEYNEVIDDFIDEEPSNSSERDDAGQFWSGDFSLSNQDSITEEIENDINIEEDDTDFDDHSLEYDLEDETRKSNINEIHVIPSTIPKEIMENELFMEPGTEPPKNIIRDNFHGLKARNSKTSSGMKNDVNDNVPIIFADDNKSQSTLDTFDYDKKIVKQTTPISDLSKIYSEAPVDHNIEVSNHNEVMITEDSEWTVEPIFSETLPEIYIKPAYSSNETPIFVEPESNEPIFVEEPIFEENSEPVEITQPMMINATPIIPVPVEKLIPNFANFTPKWDPDMPLDTERFYSLSDAEKLILQIASIREISPSDNELQARLEVGRPRLSQLYNGLQKSGMLSVRKQGRTRQFKLSNAAAEEF
tara:strand:+ start:4237 stop:6219 length:1983 start_codon:yes stop_codon:yes gene_type:complete